jgi:cobalamin biosynthesis Mg chelatase CobN
VVNGVRKEVYRHADSQDRMASVVEKVDVQEYCEWFGELERERQLVVVKW